MICKLRSCDSRLPSLGNCHSTTSSSFSERTAKNCEEWERNEGGEFYSLPLALRRQLHNPRAKERGKNLNTNCIIAGCLLSLVPERDCCPLNGLDLPWWEMIISLSGIKGWEDHGADRHTCAPSCRCKCSIFNWRYTLIMFYKGHLIRDIRKL